MTRPVPLPLSLRGLLVVALVLPALLLVGVAWFDWRRLNAEAEEHLQRVATIVKEHALKVVETNALVLDRLDDRLRDLGWDQIERQGADIQRDMRAIDEAIAHITALHVVRPDGAVLLLSSAWPTPPFNIAGRDYFQAVANGAPGIVFGRPAVSQMSGQSFFAMARRRGGVSGGFDGVILGSILPRYFEDHWHALGLRRGATVALLREDGLVLASMPVVQEPAASGAATGRPPGDLMAAIHRIDGYPLVVSVSLPRGAIHAEWLRDIRAAAALCLAATLALTAVTLLAVRRWRSEQATQARLSTTAEELRAEIARREDAEAGLMQAQRLEALGRLTGGIAHDFNNLLTAILGTVQLLERHLGGAADDRSRRLLGVAQDAVGRGARLTASLLAFARRQTLQPMALDANALVRGITPLIKGALGEAIVLTLDLERDLPPCQADTAQLEAALLNLAINARDAMPNGAGHCVLTTRRTRLEAESLGGNSDARPGEYVAISLADSGYGMSAETRERAFEPFFTTKEVGRGTGLGLSQVFGFVRQLGGHVSIESTLGAGSTVALYLPLARPDTTPAAPGATPAATAVVARATPPPGVTVLVAEDDAQVRDVTVETLRGAGMQVLAAADGAEAIALLRASTGISVLFSDIVMPGGMNGIALAQAARQLRPGLPVLLASGHSDIAAAGGDGGFEILPKPYDQEVLLRRLASLAGRHVRDMA